MRRKLLSTLLLALVCLAGGSVTVMAQTPEPTAKWTFSNTEDLMAPSVGNLTMTPCVIPANKTIAVSNISDAGIVTADGPADGVPAIAVPKASALKVSRAEGAETSTTYSILMDFMVPDAQPFNGLLQMDETNQNDGDLFTNKGQIGIGSIKYAGKIEANKWYRVVFTYNTNNESGKARIYLNGQKIAEGNENVRHIMQPFGFYVLCDEDGEKIDLTYISQVALWETPLTDEEVAELGDAFPPHEHNYVNFHCTVCGEFQADYLTPNANGFYEIGTAKDLTWFEQKVNYGELTANAILTADIDFAELMPETDEDITPEIDWTPIGDWGVTRGTGNAGYQGHFDGQGHTIKNLNATAKQNWFGLFGVISSNCIIENFDIYGTYNIRFQYAGGVAAYSRDINPTIRNVHSFVNINNTSAGGRQGGILGCAQVDNANWKTTIENCTYSGTLDGNDAGGGGNYGGMLGYANSNANNIVDIVNCLFDGEVLNLNPVPGGCTFGGIVGYCNSARVNIKNCLSIGTVNAKEEKFGQFFGALNGNNSTFANCYYKGDYFNGTGSVGKASGDTPVEVDDDQLGSGEVCWLLNEESFVDVAWHQVLEDQYYPVPYGNEGTVFMTGDGSYECINFEDFYGFRNAIIDAETEFAEDDNLVAYKVLIDEYLDAIQAWKSIESFEEFFEAYKAASDTKKAIKASAAKYEEYKEACEAAATYIQDNHLAGDATNTLLDYLNDGSYEAGDETYPNGSYPYIMENGNLDNDGIDAEIAFVRSLLDAAIAADGIAPGVEISRFFVNTSFADGFEGWTTEKDASVRLETGGVLDVMPIVHGYGKGAFSVSQTVTGLPNGIYMTTTNALFTANDNIALSFYAGQVFINNTVNYVMAPGEDLIPEDQAVDLVNCYLKDDKVYDGEFGRGYVPTSRNGSSYAFKSGRYKNYCAAEVTDGSLTVGVRGLGTGLALDWLPFNDMHIVYLGTADEASEDLTDILDGYCNRAITIRDFIWDENSYTEYPNMSEDLKTRLANAIDAVEEATTGASKMELINTFSDLFNEVFACRKAYIEMMNAAYSVSDLTNMLADLNLISEDDLLYWEGEVALAQSHYYNGDVSTEEALEIAETLNNCNLKLTSIDGVYQLASAKDLLLFQMKVNGGEDKANAVLTDDIDLSEMIPEGETEFTWTPIGNWGQNGTGVSGAAYRGHFDGQGHTISNFNITANQSYSGLFGVVSNGAVIENFNINGNLHLSDNRFNQCGTIGFARDRDVIIRNVHSALDITSEVNTKTIGGILGHVFNNSTVYIDRCSYSGTFTVTDNGGSDDGMYGGILGHSYNNANAHVNITNCLFDGTLVNTVAEESPVNGCVMGGIVGWIGTSVQYRIDNCLSIGEVTNTCAGQIAGALQNNGVSYSNNYYKGTAAFGAVAKSTNATTLVTDEQLASGEICYKLNGDQSNIVWYQTLALDSYPVLFKDHLQVWLDNGTYTNVDPDGIADVQATEPVQNGIFNLAGQRLSKPAKGINIINSKKVLVK